VLRALKEVLGRTTALVTLVETLEEQESEEPGNCTSATTSSASLPEEAGRTRKVRKTLGARQPAAPDKVKLEPAATACNCAAYAGAAAPPVVLECRTKAKARLLESLLSDTKPSKKRANVLSK
jgi:hypothetical protein